MDHPTSWLALARQLERRPPKSLTLVTNSPAIAYELHESTIHLVVTPGEVDQVMRLISGGWTEDFLSRLHFQVAFVSAAGLSLERGLTTTRPWRTPPTSGDVGRPSRGRAQTAGPSPTPGAGGRGAPRATAGPRPSSPPMYGVMAIPRACGSGPRRK